MINGLLPRLINYMEHLIRPATFFFKASDMINPSRQGREREDETERQIDRQRDWGIESMKKEVKKEMIQNEKW